MASSSTARVSPASRDAGHDLKDKKYIVLKTATPAQGIVSSNQDMNPFNDVRDRRFESKQNDKMYPLPSVCPKGPP